MSVSAEWNSSRSKQLGRFYRYVMRPDLRKALYWADYFELIQACTLDAGEEVSGGNEYIGN